MPKIPYTKKPVHGKAIILMFRNNWRVDVINNTDNNPTAYTSEQIAMFRKTEHDKALVYANTHNDWQSLGLLGHEVYKGDATFNKAFKVEPWEHIYLTKDKIYFFVWDTRELTRVAKRPSVDVLSYLHVEKSDNGKPIVKNGKWLHLSELLAEPITFKTDKQLRESANENEGGDMLIADSDNTSLAPDVSNTSGDLFQDAKIAFTNGKKRYWFVPADNKLYDDSMQLLTCGDIQFCIDKYNLRKDMKANESFDKYKGVYVHNTESQINENDMTLNARCTQQTYGQRGRDWSEMGLFFEPALRPGWCKFLVKPDKAYCCRLCKVLGELGYDGFKITTLWPQLAEQAGLATPEFRQSIMQGDRIIKDSGEIQIAEDFDNLC